MRPARTLARPRPQPPAPSRVRARAAPKSQPRSPALLTKPHSSQRPPSRRADRPRPSAASRTRAGGRSPADWLARGPHASTTHDRDLKASDWRSVICSSLLIDCCPPVTFFSTLSHQLALVEASIISNWCSSVAPSPDWLREQSEGALALRHPVTKGWLLLLST